MHRQCESVGAVAAAQFLIDANAFAQGEALAAELFRSVEACEAERARFVGGCAWPDGGGVPRVYIWGDVFGAMAASGVEDCLDGLCHLLNS